MRLTKTIFVSLLGLAYANTAFAQEGVIVDLRVLDNLRNSSSYESDLLFPVLPPQPVINTQPSSKAQNKVVSPKKNDKKVSSNKSSQNVSPQTKQSEKDIVYEPVKEEKIVVVDVEPLPETPDNILVTETKEMSSTAPVVQDDSTDKKIIEVQDKLNEDVVVEQPTDSLSQKEQLQTAPNIPLQKDVSNEENTINIAPKANIEATIEHNIDSKDDLPFKDDNLTKDDSLLLALPSEQNNENVASDESVNVLVFAEDSDELSPEHQKQIDDIVSAFKNERTNKIAIYSYNVDDGNDSFRKKRVSLNRAIEVRSYLIKKGFKNFSIKVVNISADSDRVNRVELQEI